jgi:hypothetical protein
LKCGIHVCIGYGIIGHNMVNGSSKNPPIIIKKLLYFFYIFHDLALSAALIILPDISAAFIQIKPN